MGKARFLECFQAAFYNSPKMLCKMNELDGSSAPGAHQHGSSGRGARSGRAVPWHCSSAPLPETGIPRFFLTFQKSLRNFGVLQL